MIQLEGVGKAYGGQTVLRDLSWRIGGGQRIGLVGPNGAGKTTLCRILAGEEEPDAGQVTRDRTTTVGYLAQEVASSHAGTVLGEALVPVDGRYRVRVTEELSEVTYLDQVQLIAVDHPSAVEIFSNDKWKSPPFPEFRLYGVERRIYPIRSRGGDFRRDAKAVAEMHALELDFGAAAPENRALIMASELGTRNAAPTPCSTRAATSTHPEGATAHSTDETAKINKPIRRTLLLPNWSDTAPATRIKAPSAKR